MYILVINAGSSSLKYQVFNADNFEVKAKGLCEDVYKRQAKFICIPPLSQHSFSRWLSASNWAFHIRHRPLAIPPVCYREPIPSKKWQESRCF